MQDMNLGAFSAMQRAASVGIFVTAAFITLPASMCGESKQEDGKKIHPKPTVSQLHKFEWKHGFESLVFSPDGGTLAAAGNFGEKVFVWDAKTGKTKIVLEAGANVKALDFDPEGRLAVATRGKNPELALWEVKSGNRILSLPCSLSIIAFQFDGRAIFTVNGGVIQRRDPKKCEYLRGTTAEFLLITAMAVSPDGKTVATGGGAVSKLVKLWDTDAFTNSKTLRGHEDGIKAICFSPDGSRVASSSFDHTLRIWDVKSGEMIKKVSPGANSLAYSPDGKWLAAARNNNVAILDAATLEEVIALKTPDNAGMIVRFNRQGTLLATAGIGTVQIWEITSAPGKKK